MCQEPAVKEQLESRQFQRVRIDLVVVTRGKELNRWKNYSDLNCRLPARNRYDH